MRPSNGTIKTSSRSLVVPLTQQLLLTFETTFSVCCFVRPTMGIPAVVVLGVIIWIITCAFKYWYFGKMKVNYTHKIDEKLLEDIRRPSKRVIEMAMKRKREPTFVNEPKVGYPFQPAESQSNQEDIGEPKNDDKSQEQKDGKGEERRPTIFEEIDLLQKQGKVKKKKTGKYNKSMFEDPLTRLYRDLREEKTKK